MISARGGGLRQNPRGLAPQETNLPPTTGDTGCSDGAAASCGGLSRHQTVDRVLGFNSRSGTQPPRLKCGPPSTRMAPVTASRLPAVIARTLLTCVLIVCTALLAGTAAAGQTAAPVAQAPAAEIAATAEDVWLVSTRRLPDIGCLPARAAVDVERLAAEGGCSRWRRADLAELLDDPARPVAIFVHGNRYDPASARSQGLMLARTLRQVRPEAAAIRTVIFSWPSEKEGILLRDSRAKYERSMTEGQYLAWLLAQFDPQRPVALVGYSYGALITLEAIDNLGRAERTGREPPGHFSDRPGRLHLVLVAAAVRQDALAPRGEYRQVARMIDRLALFNNTRDKALGYFEFIDRSLRTEALGHEQMPASWLPPQVEFRQVDAAAIVGKDHRFPLYLESRSLRQRLAAAVLDGLSGE